jgi:hypothetical protein
MFRRPLLLVLGLFAISSFAACQQDSAAGATPDPAGNAVPDADHYHKHIFYIIPNFRTSPELNPYVPISAKEKFTLARQDSFDRGTVALAALFAAEDMGSNANRSFGEGVEGYSKYLGASYGGFVIGNYMTEGIFPAMLHQDPRYFRRGHGSFLARVGYTVGQSFITHGDSGRMEFNASEIFGNSAAVAISEIYEKDNRTAHDAVSALAIQVGVDTAANILKEFWPDIDRRFGGKHGGDSAPSHPH